MSDYDDLRAALSGMAQWAQAAMDDSKPNSGMYGAAKSDRDWANRKLAEVRKRP